MAPCFKVAMGIVRFCCRWLLWSILIVSRQHCQGVVEPRRVCPRGQLIHKFKDSYHVMCCYPIRCGVGKEVQPCTINGTQDSCQVCSANQNQSLRTSSFTMERCTDWLLDKKCKSVDSTENWNIVSEQIKRCMCNIEQGKMFSLPQNRFPEPPVEAYCQRIKEQCPKGFEPHVDGGCRPCKENYFKSVEGFSLCEPKTNCTRLGLEYTNHNHSDAEADSVCSQPDPVITTKSTIAGKSDTPKTLPEITFPVSSQSSTTTSWATTWSENIVYFGTSRGSESAHEDKEANILWPVVSVIVIVVLVAVSIGLVMFWRRRRRMSICTCARIRDCVDSERNHSQGSRYEPRVLQIKHEMGNGYMRNGVKTGNNYGNGGVPSSIENLPNGHANGDIPHGHFDQFDPENVSTLQYTNALHSNSVLPRPDILRVAKKRVAFGQRPGMSLDSFDQEMLQVRVNGFDANPNLGETDFLLVPEHTQGASALIQTDVNSEHILALNGCGMRNFGQIFLQNSPLSQPVPRNGSAAIYTPAADEVRFTRSVSLIASPEGEVDEEFKYPRFSLLLQEGEDTSVTDSSNDASVVRSTNHQGKQASQQQASYPKVLVGSVTQDVPQTDQPDHQIMTLKRQELMESLHSSSSGIDSNNLPEMTTDLKLTASHAPVTSKEAEQTKLKILMCPSTDKFSNTSASGNIKTIKGRITCEGLEQSDLAERNKHKIGGANSQITKVKKCIQRENNFQDFSDRKYDVCRSSNSAPNTQDHHHASGDLQRPCVKSSKEEGDSTNAKHHHHNLEVTFEEDESLCTSSDQQDQTEPWQSVMSQTSPEKLSTCKRAPLRSVSDPEQANAAQAFMDNDTKWKFVPQISSSSSKASVSSDSSGVDYSTSGANKSAIYRRSQSQSAPSSSESSHKLPPRSMSEEKPQKLDRPVAKVKPMPASDSSVNQLPDDSSVMPQLSVPAAAASTNASSILSSSSSDESDHECDMEGSHSST